MSVFSEGIEMMRKINDEVQNLEKENISIKKQATEKKSKILN